MNRFAFILNPLDVRNVHEYFPLTRLAPRFLVERALRSTAPFKLHYVESVRSCLGTVVDGYFIACPLTSRQMLDLEEQFVAEKIMASVRLAERLGAEIVGLGALTGIIGGGGERVARDTRLAVTNGASLASAAILETIQRAADLRNLSLPKAKVLIVGATNAIGQNCAAALADRVSALMLVSRNQQRLDELHGRLKNRETVTKIPQAGKDLGSAMSNADIIIFTTSAIETPWTEDTGCIKKDTIICDIPSPRNISQKSLESRPDIMVIDGAVIIPPEGTHLGLKLPLHNGSIFACMAETMILALEQKVNESFSTGFTPDLTKVVEIAALAKKHGFRIQFTSFEKAIAHDQTTIL